MNIIMVFIRSVFATVLFLLLSIVKILDSLFEALSRGVIALGIGASVTALIPSIVHVVIDSVITTGCDKELKYIVLAALKAVGYYMITESCIVIIGIAIISMILYGVSWVLSRLFNMILDRVSNKLEFKLYKTLGGIK